MMPGKEMGDLTVEEITQVSDAQLSDLVDTLITVNQRGIEIDPKPSNFFYDPKEGYGIVDYHSSKVAAKGSKDQELGDVVGWIATVIGNAGFYGKPYKSEKTVDDYAHDLAFTKANLEVMKRCRTVVEAKLTGEALQKALDAIDKRLRSEEGMVSSYSDPQYIADRIAQAAEAKRQRDEEASKQSGVHNNWTALDFV